ncbi:PAS domain S-box protein [Bradyrhizobium jicamae]|uniref:histidine kinase n=1 Tax=Bradyrhizobium jicamae TaxID=280332 RepID=A0ABS5FBN4_9BRAD|nr:PAS domain S-box protein [Bradyrhizobium jicamae]MBR0794196.1 PAS domain S-box protein [Bradyrhizobium jicamae]
MTLTTRLALAMIALVAIVVSAVGWLSYRSLEQALAPRVLDRIETQVRFAASALEARARTTPGDITILQALPAVSGLMRARLNNGVDPVDGLTEAVWRQRLETQLAAQLALKPAYSLRFVGIADNHREIARVDRFGPGGAVRIVPEQELKQVGDAAYFRNTINLPPEGIYVSPIGLNEENGVVETPHVATMMVAKPVRTPDGKPFGIVIINADMRSTLESVRESARPGERVYVVDAGGNYLVNPDRAREFGAQLGTATDWRHDMPNLAGALGTTQGVAKIVDGQAGREDCVVALAPTLLAGREWVAVIDVVPNNVFMAPATAIRNSTILVGSLAVLGAAALAWLIARSLTRPITRLTAAVERVTEKGTAAIPVNALGETGVLARAFARVMDEANAKTVALEREVAEHRRTEVARDHHAERERLFTAAVESSNDAIITEQLDGTISGWNPAAGRLFGYSEAEAVGQNVALIVPPDRRAEIGDIMRRIGWGERIEQNETVLMRKDGAPVEVSLSVSPIKAMSGAIIGISKTARDISERNRNEQALWQQAEERRRIFETSQDLIMVLNSRGEVVQISPSCKIILDYRPEDLIGRSGANFIHPDDLERSQADIRALRRGQQPKISDARCVHRSGREVWLSWLGVWSEPVKRFYLVGRDMTESRKSQERLRESAQLARGIINGALDAFVQISQNGVIRDWNTQAETMFGWSRDEAIGRNVFELMGRPGGPLRTALAGFLQSGGEQVRQPRREVQIWRRDGTEFTAELSITALKTRDGFVFNGFIRDLTDKIAAEDRIRQSEKMEAVGLLTGGIAHDFNNILTVITGTIEILADAVKNEPQLAAITRMIDEAASRGADLTQQLLAFARKQPLEPREIDINTLIVDTAKLLRRTLGEQVDIRTSFEDEKCLAVVDPNRLANALLNLALNARDAMPHGGRLTVETASVLLDESYTGLHGDVRPGPYAMIAVSDTGVGIASDMLDKVFDPFVTSKGPGKGTGLGLSMVYGFVKQSAGHIKIYSEEGHGTTIRLYLPPASGAATVAEAAAPSDLEGGHETILVVEDDKLVRDYVLAQLHGLGYVTLEAANAKEALAIVEAGTPFDLLFTDVIMPGLNGRQLAERIFTMKPELRVLYTSGYTENAIIHHGRLDEGVLLLPKPYRKSELAAMIRKALAD